MTKVALALFLVVLVPAVGLAQRSDEQKSQGYAFFAPGVAAPGSISTVQFGVGGEGLVYKGGGVGGELGYVAPSQSFGGGLGVLSANGSYNFSRRKKLVPFVTGGYTLLFRAGSANGVNFGGGINYWLRKRVGLRLEFRDQIFPALDGKNFLGFRIGLSFR